MESISKNSIFGLKLCEKWSRKNLFEIPPCGRRFFLTYLIKDSCEILISFISVVTFTDFIMISVISLLIEMRIAQMSY